MKILFTTLVATLTVWTATPVQAAGALLTVPVSQEISVTLVPAEHLLIGESTLSHAVSPGVLDFMLNPNAHILGVASDGRPLAYRMQSGRLTVTPEPAKNGPVSVTIRYRLIMNDPLPAATAGSEDPSYGVKGSITDRGAFLGGDAGWYPIPQITPLRRTVRINAPAGMEGITAGERLGRETAGGVTRSVWQEERPVGDLALAAGSYVIKERQLPGILVSTYLYPDNAHLADSYLEAASGYLRLYSDLFGPYPFTKFAVVENFFPTGYGFPSFTLLGSTVIRLPFMTTTSLPHEIAHSWWGNGVLVDMDQGNWCEGLVTYLADHLLEERKGGTAGRDSRLRMLTDFSLLVPGDHDFPLSRFSSRVDPASRAIGYGKGAMLWHMLRSRVGDEAFFAALRQVYLGKRFQHAGWGDFRQALEERSGQKLDGFMTPWLGQAGGPTLSLADVESRQRDGKWLVTGRVVQTPPLFPLLVPLRLETVDRRFDQTLSLTGGERRFHFLSDTPPRRVLLDPDVDLFRRLTAGQLPPNVNRLKGSRQLLTVTTASCGVDDGVLARLLASLGQEGGRIIREAELPRAGGNHDLLFCGVPAGVGAVLELPPSVALGEGGFRFEGMHFSDPGDLLLLVARQRGAPGLVGALFLPQSAVAAERALPKISHYGSYATLVFSGGVNRHKGRVPQQPAADETLFPDKEQP